MKRWIIWALLGLAGMPAHGADLTLAEAERQDETGASSETYNSTTGDSESTTAEQSTG